MEFLVMSKASRLYVCRVFSCKGVVYVDMDDSVRVLRAERGYLTHEEELQGAFEEWCSDSGYYEIVGTIDQLEARK